MFTFITTALTADAVMHLRNTHKIGFIMLLNIDGLRLSVSFQLNHILYLCVRRLGFYQQL